MPDPLDPTPADAHTTQPPARPGSLPPAARDRAECLEELWRLGERPSLADLLTGLSGAERRAALRELAHVELELRLKAGEPASADEYLARYPDLADDADAGRSLAGAEERLRRRYGRSPDPASAWEARGKAGPAETLPVGRYEVRAELGRGGMGAVLHGRDPLLGRDLAVKVLLDRHRDRPEFRRRFLEEARIAARLQHPGVVPVYDVGTLPDGRPFFSMKLVEGRTLTELLRERPDPGHDRPRFLAVFLQVCQAVAYAHSRGVVHRDLKPSNVMVGSFGEVQVMDWGLAKVLVDPSPERERRGDLPVAHAPGSDRNTPRSPDLSLPGQAVGTPAYMPPEQARGEADRVGPRSDVFGLGAILCEVLTGQPPYANPDSRAAFARAEAADLGPVFARLDGCGAAAELVGLAKRCLAPEPADRPADAAAVAAAVQDHLSGVEARLRRAELDAAAAQARAAEERRRRRWQLALAGLVLAAGGGWGWLESRESARRADQARQAEERSNAVAAALDEAAAHLRAAEWPQAASALARAEGRLGDAGPDDLRRRLDGARADLRMVSRLDEIRLRRSLIGGDGELDRAAAPAAYATAFREFGFDPADPMAASERLLRSQVRDRLVAGLDDWALWTKAPGERPRLLAAARAAAAGDPWLERFHDPAAWEDRAALEGLAERAADFPLPPGTLEVLAFLLKHEGGDPVPVLRRAQQRHPDDFWVNFELGGMVEDREPGERARREAVGYYRAALAARPQAAAAQSNLAIALGQVGQFGEAEALFRAALAAWPDSSRLNNNLANCLAQQGRYAEAEAACREAIRLRPGYFEAHTNLGVALLGLKRPAEAEAALREALSLRPDFPQAFYNLANALFAQGRLPEAEAAYRAAIRYRPTYAAAHESLGLLLGRQDRSAEAEPELREAIRLAPDTPSARSTLGNVLMSLGKVAEAEAAFREALRLRPDDVQTSRNLGILLGRNGRDAQAEAAFRDGLRRRPDDPDLLQLLGMALENQGRYADALAVFRRSHDLSRTDPRLHAQSGGRAARAERLAALESRLPAVLDGAGRPAPAELLQLAELCRLRGRPVAGARLADEAFAADPRLAADLPSGRRYNAACAAAVAVRPADPRLPGKARSSLRRQALDWLREDLTQWRRSGEGPSARPALRETLAHWLDDADLAGLREEKALAALPAAERSAWRALWADVTDLLCAAGS
jgi:serine/threonine-protein kinase